MLDVDDIALLREYVDGRSESAFAGIVQRRVNLVYSVALRFTGNSEDAQDVTQAVFVILAKKAAGLRPNTILTGWLYETTRFTAMNLLTQKNRRQTREQEAYMQTALNEAETIWPQLAPLLESAMSRLNEKDRTLVALRFFENRSMAETAALLGVNEPAARKRAERVIEKLRQYFSKLGVTSTAETIAGAISANSIQAAPVALAKSVTAVALAKGAVATASTLTLVKGALKIMAWTKAKTGMVGVIVMVVVLTATTVVIRHAHVSRNETWTANQLADAGYATPEAAMKTLLWGISRGDADTVSGSLTPTESVNAQRAFPGQFRATVAAWGKRMTATNFQIVVEGGSSDNVTIDLVSSGADGQPHERKYWFKKVGKEWKCDQVHPSFDLSN